MKILIEVSEPTQILNRIYPDPDAVLFEKIEDRVLQITTRATVTRLPEEESVIEQAQAIADEMAEATPKRRFEYRFAFMGGSLGAHRTEGFLTEWGSDGWELTGIVENTPSGKYYLMKREL